MGREKPSKKDTGRDPGGFAAIPWVVLDSPAYLALSHPAKALLMEVARQFHRDDNGRMLLSQTYLKTRGWKSADVINRAKQELLGAEFIFETVKGHRPNKASWYAVTWRKLDKLAGYDEGVDRVFRQGAYRKNAPLTPSPGVEASRTAPSPGVRGPPTSPPPGAIRPISRLSSTPSHGDPLEKPSPVPECAIA